MKRLLSPIFIVAFITILLATIGWPCFADTTNSGTFSDNRDGHIYKWVKIGKQVWMAENLSYLPSVYPSSSEVETFVKYYVMGYCEGYKKGCNVNEAKANQNYITYGVLYDWEAALTACPSGWHLPSDAEWTALRSYLGGEIGAGGKIKEAGIAHWKTPNEGGKNTSGFTAVPSGYRTSNGSFVDRGLKARFWSSSAAVPAGTSYWMVKHYHDYLSQSKIAKSCGLSVRCLQN